jgi:hypothetical protein
MVEANHLKLRAELIPGMFMYIKYTLNNGQYQESM